MITPAYGLTATERVLPGLTLDFTTASLDARVSLTRALNTATRVNSSGYIETINANLPRFDYSSTSISAIRGLLIEESRVNTLGHSNDFAGATWTASGITQSTSSLTSPDGTTNATLFTGSAFSYIYAGGKPNAAGTWSYSFFFSKGTITNPTLQITQAGNGYGVTFDLNAQAAGAATIVGTGGAISNMTGAVSVFNSTWLRCSITFTTSSSVNNAFLYVGNGTLHVYGAQLELGASVSSYIPTSGGATATRNADVAVMTGTNFSSWYNQSQGTALVRAIPYIVTGTRPLVQFDDTTANERVALRNNVADPELYVVDGGALQVQLDAGTVTANTQFNLCGAWKVNDFAVTKDGAAAVTSSSGTIPTPSQLRLGSDGTNYLNGALRTVQYWAARLPNTQIQYFAT